MNNEPFELPEYLVFLILGHIKELRTLNPDHILVKAVENALAQADPYQHELDLENTMALMRKQAD